MEPIGRGLSVLAQPHMIVHAAAHLFADGDLTGGLRNLWDIRCLLQEFGGVAPAERARLHGLEAAVARAARMVGVVCEGATARGADRLYARRLLARDRWGRATRPATRLAFHARSYALRTPPALLARHLWTKWRRSLLHLCRKGGKRGQMLTAAWRCPARPAWRGP